MTSARPVRDLDRHPEPPGLGWITKLGGDDAGVDLLPFAESDACRLVLPRTPSPAPS